MIFRSILAVVLSAGLCAGQVELRGSPGPLEAEVLGVSIDGVEIAGEAPGARAVTIGWHRVRRVGGEWEHAADAFSEYAMDLWRASFRLDRGDLLGAEPLFEAHFPAYEQYAGITSAVVGEGLLACRLGRGARIDAIRPWLMLLRTTEPMGPLGTGLVDPEIGLVPGLPPIWSGVEGLQGAAIRPDPLTNGVKPGAIAERAATLAEWYEHGLARHRGEQSTMPQPDGTDPAVMLVASVVLATDPDPEVRENARAELRRIIGARGGEWPEAWCRAAIGASLVRERDRTQRLAGVVSLLHVPSRFGATQRHLAGVCLAEASVTLASLGDAYGASRLARELETRYPGHPSLADDRLRSIMRDSQGTGAGGAARVGAVRRDRQRREPG